MWCGSTSYFRVNPLEMFWITLKSISRVTFFYRSFRVEDLESSISVLNLFHQPQVSVYKRLHQQHKRPLIIAQLECNISAEERFVDDWALPRRSHRPTPLGAGWLIQPAQIRGEPPCSSRHTCWCTHLIPAEGKVEDNMRRWTSLFLVLYDAAVEKCEQLLRVQISCTP